MKRSFILIELILILSIIFSGCSSKESNEDKDLKVTEEIEPSKHLKVLVSVPNHLKREEMISKLPLSKYSEEFEKQTNIKVEFEEIEGELGHIAKEDLKKKLNVRLHSGDVPTIICMRGSLDQLDQYGNNGPFLDLTDLEGYDDIINLMKGKNYVCPIFRNQSYIIHKDYLKDFDISKYEKGMDSWDEYQIFKALNPDLKVEFGNYVYFRLIRALKPFELKIKDGKADFTLNDIKESAQKLRNELYSGRYIVPEDLSYSNYKEYTDQETKRNEKLNTELTSKMQSGEIKTFVQGRYLWEFDEKIAYDPEIYIPSKGMTRIDREYDVEDLKLIPAKDGYAHGYGFMIVKNSSKEDIAAARKYIEFLISKEIQNKYLDCIYGAMEGEKVNIYVNIFGPASTNILNNLAQKTKENKKFKSFEELIKNAFELMNDEEFIKNYKSSDKAMPWDLKKDTLEMIRRYLFDGDKVDDREMEQEFNEILKQINIKIAELDIKDNASN